VAVISKKQKISTQIKARTIHFSPAQIGRKNFFTGFSLLPTGVIKPDLGMSMKT